MAVAEGFEKDGSGAPGAHVFKTTDGETWKEIYVFGADTGGIGSNDSEIGRAHV